jgi:hypothetical protein
MSTTAYGVEAIREGQKWLLDDFYRLTVAIGRTVAGTFSTAKGEDAIRAADTPGRAHARQEKRTTAGLSQGSPGWHPEEGPATATPRAGTEFRDGSQRPPTRDA